VAILGPAAPVGAYLFVFVWLVTAGLLASLLKANTVLRPLAPMAALALLFIPGYVEEGQAGRSIPLVILLISLSIFTLAKFVDRHPVLAATLFGFFLGMGAATRFDSLLLGPLVIVTARIVGLIHGKSTLAALAGWSIGPLAWSMYSIIRLHGVYVTDNARVARAPTYTFVTDWPVPIDFSVLASLQMWLARTSSNVDLVWSSLASATRGWVVIAVVALLVGFLATGQTFRSISLPANKHTTAHDPRRMLPELLLMSSLAIGLTQATLIAVTGYNDTRYWAITSFLLLLSLLTFIFALMTSNVSLANASLYRFSLGTSVAGIALFAVAGTSVTFAQYADRANQGANDEYLANCFAEFQGAIMVSGMEAFRLPATTVAKTTTVPNNAESLDVEDWTELFETYGVTGYWEPDSVDSAIPASARSLLRRVECNNQPQVASRRTMTAGSITPGHNQRG